MKHKLSIQAQLLACFGFLVLATAGASLYSLGSIRGIRDQVDNGIVAGAARLDLSRRAAIDLANMRIANRGISLFAVKNPAACEKARAAFEAAAADMRAVTGEMKAANLTAQERAAADAIEDGVMT